MLVIVVDTLSVADQVRLHRSATETGGPTNAGWAWRYSYPSVSTNKIEVSLRHVYGSPAGAGPPRLLPFARPGMLLLFSFSKSEGSYRQELLQSVSSGRVCRQSHCSHLLLLESAPWRHRTLLPSEHHFLLSEFYLGWQWCGPGRKCCQDQV